MHKIEMRHPFDEPAMNLLRLLREASKMRHPFDEPATNLRLRTWRIFVLCRSSWSVVWKALRTNPDLSNIRATQVVLEWGVEGTKNLRGRG